MFGTLNFPIEELLNCFVFKQHYNAYVSAREALLKMLIISIKFLVQSVIKLLYGKFSDGVSPCHHSYTNIS